jgi:hypothetical protein
MDKGLTVPKWVLINWPKIPQMSKNLSAQIVCPSTKVWDFHEKKVHWASLVHAMSHCGEHQAHVSYMQKKVLCTIAS